MKEEFKKILLEISEVDYEDIIYYLEEQTDFFEAPASTKYHLAYPGGLVEHSLNVYKVLKYLNNTYDMHYSSTSIAIVSLFHDICKANFYKKVTKNVKENGQWIEKEVYEVDDQFPLGHGEKSLYIISKFLYLTDEEASAIRWHMGGFESKDNYNYINKSYEKYPLAAMLNIADMIATYIVEPNKEKDVSIS